jgi:hypothetical protein
MLPDGTSHVGWLAVATGAEGAPVNGVITTSADVGDMQPASFVTVKL